MNQKVAIKRPVDFEKPMIELDEVRCAADCQKFLVGVLTTPGFRDQAMKLVDPKGGFFSDAMTETTMAEFIDVQQGPIIETVPDFEILNWRFGIDAGNIAVVKFQATASHCGIPVKGENGMIEPSGKRATWTCAWIFTLKDGKIMQLEKSFDRGSWHYALGLSPWSVMPVQPTFESDNRGA
ncbi:hypothetical protein [Sphingobium sp. Cam5-1]|uniref:hypothetical protein n=1 Tax=Sphingobium sp. Cam5-1 TaxID=2789327 RepID=UPI0018AD19D9|nr:hypothetical protein [Sphingobium sp. Cam5-1]QPI72234.1 hypothetical protein IZV00_10050 [Sphingobium sp. Cam5-1]